MTPLRIALIIITGLVMLFIVAVGMKRRKVYAMSIDLTGLPSWTAWIRIPLAAILVISGLVVPYVVEQKSWLVSLIRWVGVPLGLLVFELLKPYQIHYRKEEAAIGLLVFLNLVMYTNLFYLISNIRPIPIVEIIGVTSGLFGVGVAIYQLWKD